MMGAGGFIKNPGKNIFNSEDLVDEDDIDFNDVQSVMMHLFNDDDVDINTEVVLYFPPSDDDLDLDFPDEESDDSDEDYNPSMETSDEEEEEVVPNTGEISLAGNLEFDDVDDESSFSDEDDSMPELF